MGLSVGVAEASVDRLMAPHRQVAASSSICPSWDTFQWFNESTLYTNPHSQLGLFFPPPLILTQITSANGESPLSATQNETSRTFNGVSMMSKQDVGLAAAKFLVESLASRSS